MEKPEEAQSRVEAMDRPVHLSFSTWSRLLSMMARRVPEGPWTADEEVQLLLDLYERRMLDQYFAKDAGPCTCQAPPAPTSSATTSGKTEKVAS